MQLHDRRIKSTFWKDPVLVQWPRDLRWFYEGLIQLADDSGCLEDSPFAFKLELYPSPVDADITQDVIAEWRDRLVQEKKLVRYSVGSKDCLYLLNFQKHQTLKTPRQPEVPLPEWLDWETFKSNPSAGKYVLNKDILSKFLESSYDVLPKEVKRSEVNSIQEKTSDLDPVQSADLSQADESKNQKRSSSFDPRLAHISQVYQQSGMGQIDETVKTFLLDWIANYSDEWIEAAFREAVLQGRRKLAYVNSVLQNWHTDGGMKITSTARVRVEADSRHGPRESTGPPEYDESVRNAFRQGW